MITLVEIENFIKITPEIKINKIIEFMKTANPSNLETYWIQNEFKLNSEQTDLLSKLCHSTSDGNMLSISMDATNKLKKFSESEKFKLVMTGPFIHNDHRNVDFTQTKVYEMINNANSEIIVIEIGRAHV